MDPRSHPDKAAEREHQVEYLFLINLIKRKNTPSIALSSWQPVDSF
jgi:hypothetical protein